MATITTTMPNQYVYYVYDCKYEENRNVKRDFIYLIKL